VHRPAAKDVNHRGGVKEVFSKCPSGRFSELQLVEDVIVPNKILSDLPEELRRKPFNLFLMQGLRIPPFVKGDKG